MCWNADGLGAHRLLDGTAEVLQRADVLSIWDTRNSKLLHQLLPGHAIFTRPDVSTTNGSGGIIAIRKQLCNACRFLGWHNALPMAWVQVQSVTFGFVYARPACIPSLSHELDFIASLHAAVATHQAHGGVVVMGDFNARLGDCQDAGTLPRCVVDRACRFGRMLMHMAKECNLVSTTGRLDAGEPSRCRGDQASRIDHCFVQDRLWRQVAAAGLYPDFMGSDHKPVAVRVRVPVVSQFAPPARAPYLKWDFRKQDAYAVAVLGQVELWQQLREAISHGDVGLASVLLVSMVWAAAAAVRMVFDPAARQARQPYLKLPTTAAALKRNVRAFRTRGQPVPPALRAQWRAVIAEARLQRASHLHDRLQYLLCRRPRAFWKAYLNKGKPPLAILSDAQWRDYYIGKFAAQATPPAHPHILSDVPRVPLDSHFGAPITPSEVIDAFAKLGTAKAVGADGVPAEFISKACTCHALGTEHHFARVLADMFQLVLTTASMPVAWKVKCIHPIHKRGDVHDPVNYRPISVATTLYRMFTSIMATRLRAWQPPSGTLPLDCQFAFRPGHSVEHSHAVILSARDLALSSQRPAVIVKLDIDKAYDTVVWEKLWEVMRQLGLPPFFIALVQGLYDQVPYVVSVNDTTSRPFYCTMGLLQGCALSPMLYNLYIAPALSWLQELCTRDGLGFTFNHQPCAFTAYADDLLGALTNPAHVLPFIQHASAALAPYNQRLSLPKCQVLVMGARQPVTQTLGGLAVVPRMKVLGVWYDQHGSIASNLASRMQLGASKLGLAFRRLKDAGSMHDIRMALLVLNSDVRPTLMFGSSLWGMHGLKVADPVKHVLQRPYSTLLRKAMGVPACTAHWIVLLLTGQLPIQFHILIDFCNTWNRFCVVPAEVNALLHAAVHLQVRWLATGTRCWLREWDDALRSCLPAVPYLHVHQCLLQGVPIDVDLVTQEIAKSYLALLASFGNPCIPFCGKRKIAMVYRHMVMGALRRRPRYHSWDLPGYVRAVWIRFVACCSGLPVHELSGLVPFAERLCTKCSHHVVANELHVLFDCPSTWGVRLQYQHQLDWSNAPHHLGAFLADNCNETCAWFVFHALAAYRASP